MQFQIQTLATVVSPFKDKFGVPRQPGLCHHKTALKLAPDYNQADCFKDIEQHSHLWLLFLFHENLAQGWQPLVRPPRLGGNKRTGVWATRSSFRPNGIGMSAAKYLGAEQIDGVWHLYVEGLDLIDGTPIIDIKPYIPYCDSINSATSTLAPDSPCTINVIFEPQAKQDLEQYSAQYSELQTLIIDVLQQDPRPAYRHDKPDQKIYYIRLYDLEVKWKVVENLCHVLAISEFQQKP